MGLCPHLAGGSWVWTILLEKVHPVGLHDCDREGNHLVGFENQSTLHKRLNAVSPFALVRWYHVSYLLGFQSC